MIKFQKIYPERSRRAKIIFITILFFGFLGLAGKSKAYEHPGGFHSVVQINFVKQMIQENKQPWLNAYNQLITKANDGLNRQSHAVVDFYIPEYYADPEGSAAAEEGMQNDGLAAYSCALAYQLGGNVQYAEKARELLNSWATVNTKIDPSVSTLPMADSGNVLITAAEMLSTYPGWTTEEKNIFKTWVKDVFIRQSVILKKDWSNNHGDWGLFGLLQAAYFLDDKEAVLESINDLKIKINYSISSNGSMPAETSRDVGGLWYTYFALAPMTAACQVAYNAEHVNFYDLNSMEGEKIKSALNYLLYYIQHWSEWPYYTYTSPVGAPNDFPGNLFDAMSVVYDDANYNNYVKNYRPIFVGNYYAWTFPSLMTPLLFENPPTETTCPNQTCNAWENCSTCSQDCGVCPSAIPKTGWSLKYVDSEQAGLDGRAINAFDNNASTIWHTQYSPSAIPQPHEIQIDLGATYIIQGLKYLPRQDGSVNGTIRYYEFSTSMDGSAWNLARANVFTTIAYEKTAYIHPRSARYIKLRSLSAFNNKAWTSAAEISMLGTVGGSDATPPAAPQGLLVL